MTAALRPVATIRLVLDKSLALAELTLGPDLRLGVRARRGADGVVRIVPRDDHTSVGSFPLVSLSGGLLMASEAAIAEAWRACDAAPPAPSHAGREFG